jgi:hypothetical protein
MRYSVLILSLLSIAAFAGTKKHRHHEAHVHGAASLNMAFEKQQGQIRFQAAAQGILGFEHTPKTDKEKQVLQNVISKFEKDASKFIQFESNLGCVVQKEKIGLPEATNSEHLDFMANFQIQCQKSIHGSEIKLNFTEFPGLNDIDVTILVDDLQKSIEIKSKPVTVKLIQD